MTTEIAALLREYRCTEVTGDDYGKRWVSDAYGQHRQSSRRKSELDRSDIYLNVLPLFSAAVPTCSTISGSSINSPDWSASTFPSGKDKIDHDRGHHDDLCNAAAGALVLASRRLPIEPPIVMPYFYGLRTGEIGHGVDSMPTSAPAATRSRSPPPAAPPVAMEPADEIPVLVTPVSPPPPPVLSAAERQANVDALNAQPANPPRAPAPWSASRGGGIKSDNFSMRDRWSVNW